MAQFFAIIRFGDLGGARTLGPLIKSQLLYQLSYEVILIAKAKYPFRGCKYIPIYLMFQKIFGLIFFNVVINIGDVFVFV